MVPQEQVKADPSAAIRRSGDFSLLAGVRAIRSTGTDRPVPAQRCSSTLPTVRIEPVIVVKAEASVGPTRLHLLTASSATLPVVIVASTADGPLYHLYDVGALQSALSGELSATALSEVLNLAEREPAQAVSKSDAATAPAGTPVEDNGRLVGVIALDPPARAEPTEADMARGGADPAGGAPRKKGLWKRLTGSAD